VPRAATLSGSVVNAGDGSVVDHATAEARPGALDTRACGSAPDASTCGTDPLGVLDISLGEDAFVPRPSSGTVENGAFSIKEVDCGSCTTESPAIFDFSVRSQDGSRYPWFVRSGLSVSGDVELGRLTVPLPIIHHGVVEIPQVGQDAIVIPNALIRAYVLRDQTGAVIASPAGLSSCQAAATSKSGTRPVRCIRSVLQVAETRAASDGHFELVLPSALE
jgi:hypothetical protein